MIIQKIQMRSHFFCSKRTVCVNSLKLMRVLVAQKCISMTNNSFVHKVDNNFESECVIVFEK